jgi:hypothetical protein
MRTYIANNENGLYSVIIPCTQWTQFAECYVNKEFVTVCHTCNDMLHSL